MEDHDRRQAHHHLADVLFFQPGFLERFFSSFPNCSSAELKMITLVAHSLRSAWDLTLAVGHFIQLLTDFILEGFVFTTWRFWPLKDDSRPGLLCLTRLDICLFCCSCSHQTFHPHLMDYYRQWGFCRMHTALRWLLISRVCCRFILCSSGGTWRNIFPWDSL